MALLLVACATGCRRSAPAPEVGTPSATKQAVAPGTIAAVVLARTGKVELSRNGGGWSDARVGDQLVPSDALRTEAGEAELGLGPVHMRLHESSAVRVKETTKSSMRAQVRGAVESDVEPGRGALDVEMEGTDAVARSTGGHFFVTADGRGVVSVAAVSGSVNLVYLDPPWFQDIHRAGHPGNTDTACGAGGDTCAICAPPSKCVNQGCL